MIEFQRFRKSSGDMDDIITKLNSCGGDRRSSDENTMSGIGGRLDIAEEKLVRLSIVKRAT